MPESSERLQNLPPYAFAVISQTIREMTQQGLDIIRLDIGNPDMPPAEHVINALAESSRTPTNHGYAGYAGTPSFREAVARYYQKRFGVTLNPETQVLPLLGSKEGIVNFSLAYLDRGDVALVPTIGYPAYEMGARLAGADRHPLTLNAANGFVPDFDSIPENVAQKAKLLWVNYPNNPTGVVVDNDFYDKAIAFCQQYDVLLASDNPYVDITFDGYVGTSALQAPNALDHTVEFMSFSKTFNMAGWRLGAAVGSAQALRNLLQVKSNVDSGHFKGIYDAGIAALDQTTDDWMQERNQVYQNRRDKILEALPQIGLEASVSKATLYIWAKVLDMSSEDYVKKALEEAHVSTAPGEIYGSDGTGYIRISLSVPDDRLAEGLQRLIRWYNQ